jgi:hypothetical protein
MCRYALLGDVLVMAPDQELCVGRAGPGLIE